MSIYLNSSIINEATKRNTRSLSVSSDDSKVSNFSDGTDPIQHTISIGKSTYNLYAGTIYDSDTDTIMISDTKHNLSLSKNYESPIKLKKDIPFILDIANSSMDNNEFIDTLRKQNFVKD